MLLIIICACFQFRELELTAQNALIIECAAAYMEGKMWMCHGEQSSGKICKINCDENIMHDLNCEVRIGLFSSYFTHDAEYSAFSVGANFSPDAAEHMAPNCLA
jgi:hypothetical protein